MEDRLKLLLQLLNDVEVKGAKNLNNLLASIQLVNGLLKQEPKAEEEEFPV